ncbi:MAG TPA: flagellar basal body rod protein FlgC [Burkholderiales bacterium]|nr:flagellar basal body rod protein FlgC [Burkholderiales bacterium]
MSSFKIFEIAGSALTAQSQRLNVVASNLANADSATGSDGAAYQAKQVVFEATPADRGRASGVRVSTVITDPSPMRRVYEPKHPMADSDGYVSMPNVNVVEEMVNMIDASRAYQNSIEVMNTAKSLMLRALTLGQ